MANIEVSLSSTNTPRRRKGTSLGGNTSSSRPSNSADNPGINSNVKPEHHSALQEREAIIQSLRMQFGVGKLPRSGELQGDTDVSNAERELQKLRNDSDNKQTIIRNFKTALENLDIQDK